jgi:hypothetical protein
LTNRSRNDIIIIERKRKGDLKNEKINAKYIANDGKEFDIEFDCMEYERNERLIKSIVLLDFDKNRITSIDDMTEAYYAYFPTKEDLQWFLDFDCFGMVNTLGMKEKVHLYYNADENDWFSVEDQMEELKEILKGF